MIFLAGFSRAQLTLMLHAELLACTLPRSKILPFFHTCGLLRIRCEKSKSSEGSLFSPILISSWRS